MKLFIVRHAWAADRDDTNFPDDRLRPLTPEGRYRFNRMVKKLVAIGFCPRLIATSSLVRCRQTAEIVAEQLGGHLTVVEREELLPGAAMADLWRWTVSQEAQPLAWVGHAPDVSQLTARLIGAPNGQIRFAKGSVASIEFGDDLAPARGELQWLATAKLLGV